MRIWKIPVYLLAALAFSNLGHSARANLSKTAKSGSSQLKARLAESVTPPKSYYLLGTEARHLKVNFTEELTKNPKINNKTAQLSNLLTRKTQTVTDQYIAQNEAPQNTAPQTDELENLRTRFRIPSTKLSKLTTITQGIISTPGSSVASPTAFGASFGDVFVGGSYQTRVRFADKDDGGLVFGFGLGDRKLVGLEVAISSFSTLREGFFSNGGVSLKLHHLFPDNLAIALGVENAATFGSPDAGSSVYGVASKVFQLKDDITKPFSSVTVSLGLGGGRFRSEHDVQKRIDSVNVFGSVGVRLAEPISFIADWTGQDLTLGTSIAPFRKIPVVITPAVADVTGNAGDGARFILGFGFGYTF
ncbi:hypothetical protein G7B40_009995 [Aetokthonos hydrillicola Thurmond2011]|jgi:hypothetical protein|uniref:Uncharacterized protein n=1 Tax=Aetokthonos hydrillicola Thurmond2011 TaxID=2712845 RepID=A0AAP5I570_9CYAN|nr:hypothetical protein [Aetokthonos hydrillicola]MBO3463499.1 hypothetical protein [Aetokthonos hydrillicola CCALA 1050]MBW4590052.1 hypothetical protein [Aetokthonos hydrillicola CCALA 1050]MDR9894895.1 hypothetical protein [Aetokthonos hydrillicola Thurmond2011]